MKRHLLSKNERTTYLARGKPYPVIIDFRRDLMQLEENSRQGWDEGAIEMLRILGNVLDSNYRFGRLRFAIWGRCPLFLRALLTSLVSTRNISERQMECVMSTAISANWMPGVKIIMAFGEDALGNSHATADLLNRAIEGSIEELDPDYNNPHNEIADTTRGIVMARKILGAYRVRIGIEISRATPISGLRVVSADTRQLHALIEYLQVQVRFLRGRNSNPERVDKKSYWFVLEKIFAACRNGFLWTIEESYSYLESENCEGFIAGKHVNGEKVATIFALEVNSCCRYCGMGSELVKCFTGAVRSRGAKFVRLRGVRRISVGFWRRIGFRRVETLRGKKLWIKRIA